MNFAEGVSVCPFRGNLDLSAVQFSDYSNVQFFEPSDFSDDECQKVEQGKFRRTGYGELCSYRISEQEDTGGHIHSEEHLSPAPQTSSPKRERRGRHKQDKDKNGKRNKNKTQGNLEEKADSQPTPEAHGEDKVDAMDDNETGTMAGDGVASPAQGETKKKMRTNMAKEKVSVHATKSKKANGKKPKSSRTTRPEKPTGPQKKQEAAESPAEPEAQPSGEEILASAAAAHETGGPELVRSGPSTESAAADHLEEVGVAESSPREETIIAREPEGVDAGADADTTGNKKTDDNTKETLVNAPSAAEKEKDSAEASPLPDRNVAEAAEKPDNSVPPEATAIEESEQLNSPELVSSQDNVDAKSEIAREALTKLPETVVESAEETPIATEISEKTVDQQVSCASGTSNGEDGLAIPEHQNADAEKDTGTKQTAEDSGEAETFDHPASDLPAPIESQESSVEAEEAVAAAASDMPAASESTEAPLEADAAAVSDALSVAEEAAVPDKNATTATEIPESPHEAEGLKSPVLLEPIEGKDVANLPPNQAEGTEPEENLPEDGDAESAITPASQGSTQDSSSSKDSDHHSNAASDHETTKDFNTEKYAQQDPEDEGDATIGPLITEPEPAALEVSQHAAHFGQSYQRGTEEEISEGDSGKEQLPNETEDTKRESTEEGLSPENAATADPVIESISANGLKQNKETPKKDQHMATCSENSLENDTSKRKVEQSQDRNLESSDLSKENEQESAPHNQEDPVAAPGQGHEFSNPRPLDESNSVEGKYDGIRDSETARQAQEQTTASICQNEDETTQETAAGSSGDIETESAAASPHNTEETGPSTPVYQEAAVGDQMEEAPSFPADEGENSKETCATEQKHLIKEGEAGEEGMKKSETVFCAHQVAESFADATDKDKISAPTPDDRPQETEGKSTEESPVQKEKDAISENVDDAPVSESREEGSIKGESVKTSDIAPEEISKAPCGPDDAVAKFSEAKEPGELNVDEKHEASITEHATGEDSMTACAGAEKEPDDGQNLDANIESKDNATATTIIQGDSDFGKSDDKVAERSVDDGVFVESQTNAGEPEHEQSGSATAGDHPIDEGSFPGDTRAPKQEAGDDSKAEHSQESNPVTTEEDEPNQVEEHRATEDGDFAHPTDEVNTEEPKGKDSGPGTALYPGAGAEEPDAEDITKEFDETEKGNQPESNSAVEAPEMEQHCAHGSEEKLAVSPEGLPANENINGEEKVEDATEIETETDSQHEAENLPAGLEEIDSKDHPEGVADGAAGDETEPQAEVLAEEAGHGEHNSLQEAADEEAPAEDCYSQEVKDSQIQNVAETDAQVGNAGGESLEPDTEAHQAAETPSNDSSPPEEKQGEEKGAGVNACAAAEAVEAEKASVPDKKVPMPENQTNDAAEVKNTDAELKNEVHETPEEEPGSTEVDATPDDPVGTQADVPQKLLSVASEEQPTDSLVDALADAQVEDTSGEGIHQSHTEAGDKTISSRDVEQEPEMSAEVQNEKNAGERQSPSEAKQELGPGTESSNKPKKGSEKTSLRDGETPQPSSGAKPAEEGSGKEKESEEEEGRDCVGPMPGDEKVSDTNSRKGKTQIFSVFASFTFPEGS